MSPVSSGTSSATGRWSATSSTGPWPHSRGSTGPTAARTPTRPGTCRSSGWPTCRCSRLPTARPPRRSSPASSDGLYVVGDKSWSIDMQRYNFQFTGQRFFRIESGRLAGQVKDVAYQATTTDFWGSLVGARRPADVPAGRRVQLRQGPARPGRRGQPRSAVRGLRRRQDPQHRSGGRPVTSARTLSRRRSSSGHSRPSTADGCVVRLDGEQRRPTCAGRATRSTTNGLMRGRSLTVIATVDAAEGTAAGVVSSSHVDEAQIVDARTPGRAGRPRLRAGRGRPATAQWSPRRHADWDDAPAQTSTDVFAAFAPALGEALRAARADGRELFGFAEHDAERRPIWRPRPDCGCATSSRPARSS